MYSSVYSNKETESSHNLINAKKLTRIGQFL
ncbi:hypothetical protein YG5714_2989 [Sulfolobus islandicus Y.G.57.14]|uniref:Uncharacterized protein n=2 Tax=Saccharolobus islandicus TaxID=43080 RepID=C3N8D4_SACI7|nr:hypothetical protein YG5714_2989 [Sulfolobus islandicus Y.G.57.14]ADX81451.1 hypothetical protein SiH_0079 [Sulfolobus islandicus HVE10/4]